MIDEASPLSIGSNLSQYVTIMCGGLVVATNIDRCCILKTKKALIKDRPYLAPRTWRTVGQTEWIKGPNTAWRDMLQKMYPY